LKRNVILISGIVAVVLIIGIVLFFGLESDTASNTGEKNILQQFTQKFSNKNNSGTPADKTNADSGTTTQTGSAAGTSGSGTPTNSTSGTITGSSQAGTTTEDTTTGDKPSLMLSPSSGTYKVGSTFDVKILANSQGKEIQVVDLMALNYDPKLLKVVDGDSVKAGVQIDKGDILPNVLFNLVDENAGKIKFSSAVNLGSKSQSVNGIIATVKFQVLAAGQARLNPDFTKGGKADCSMIALENNSNPIDILETVTGADFVLN